MEKSVIAEGKTTKEAIDNGLKQLKVSKNKVDIKVLEKEEKRSFFSILAPRVVKVELTLKEPEELDKQEEKSQVISKEKKKIQLTLKQQEQAEKNVKEFMEEMIKYLPENTQYTIKKEERGLNIDINNSDLGYLIGYRGDTLYALQTILSSIANKKVENKVRVILDIQGYKEKREKTLEELASKVAKTVIRTKKQITLEPMQAYERKIIHSKLQENDKIETYSIGEEPYRKIVIRLKKK